MIGRCNSKWRKSDCGVCALFLWSGQIPRYGGDMGEHAEKDRIRLDTLVAGAHRINEIPSVFWKSCALGLLFVESEEFEKGKSDCQSQCP